MPEILRRLRPGVLAACCLISSAVPSHAESAPTETAPAVLPGDARQGDGVSGVEPPSLVAGKLAKVRSVRLDPPDLAALLAEDALRGAERPDRKLERTGVVRRAATVRAPHRFDRSRQVSRLEDGRYLWTLDVTSPGATAVRLALRRSELPEGAEIVISNPDRPGEAFGPYAPHVARGGAPLWLPSVFAERARIDVTVPAASVRERVHVELDRVLHQYRTIASADVAPDSARKAGTCEVDVRCDADLFADFGHAVGRMSFVSGVDSYVCTGTLLNDNAAATSIPWFLTANHCISTTPEASSLEVFWDYYASGCGGTVPTLVSRPRTSGSTLTVTSSVSDFSLLRLTGSLPSGRTFAGWTTELPAGGDTVYGVHHPEGSHMRASQGLLDGRDASFHDVRWTSGVTEPGSSGSPLIDATGLVVGQLCCGDSSCANPNGVDSYGRLDRAYSALQPFLDPADGENPNLATYVEPFPFVLDRALLIELGEGEWSSWSVNVDTPPENSRHVPKLKVRVKGRRGAYVRIVFPDSTDLIVPRNARAKAIAAPPGGTYGVELHSGVDDRPKVLMVKLKRKW